MNEVSLYSDYLTWANRQTFGFFDDIKDAFKNLPSKLKEVGSLIKDIAKEAKGKVSEWITILKDSKIFKFFEYFGFSLKKIYEFVKKYSSFIDSFFQLIADYVADTKVAKWTESELKKLDAFLEKHPILKKASGVAICALLIYINTQMVYVGDPVYDFDITVAFNALYGTYKLSEVFAGPSGIKLLLMLATGVLVPTFNWSSASKAIGLIGDMIYNYYKKNISKTFSETRQLFSMLRSKCDTKEKMLAYNRLVRSLNL